MTTGEKHTARAAMISAITKLIVDKLKSEFLLMIISDENEKESCIGDINDAVSSTLAHSPAAPINTVDNVRYRFVLASQIVKAAKGVLHGYLVWQFDSEESEADFVNELEESLRAVLLEYNKVMLVEWRYA